VRSQPSISAGQKYSQRTFHKETVDEVLCSFHRVPFEVLTVSESLGPLQPLSCHLLRVTGQSDWAPVQLAYLHQEHSKSCVVLVHRVYGHFPILSSCTAVSASSCNEVVKHLSAIREQYFFQNCNFDAALFFYTGCLATSDRRLSLSSLTTSTESSLKHRSTDCLLG
jgi:hypothetical protein